MVASADPPCPPFCPCCCISYASVNRKHRDLENEFPNTLYYNAHGTSTPLGDKAETVVIKKVFGDRAYNLPVSSIKSMVGHMQGACGTSEVAACCLAMRDSILPPTINYEYPDPECDLDYIPNQARRRHIDVAVSNSFSFGGRNTAVVLRRHLNGHGHSSRSSGAAHRP